MLRDTGLVRFLTKNFALKVNDYNYIIYTYIPSFSRDQVKQRKNPATGVRSIRSTIFRITVDGDDEGRESFRRFLPTRDVIHRFTRDFDTVTRVCGRAHRISIHTTHASEDPRELEGRGSDLRASGWRTRMPTYAIIIRCYHPLSLLY